jgi:hypothetical protein
MATSDPGELIPPTGEPAGNAGPGPMHAEPSAEHRWLHRLVGEWMVETGTPATPGEPAETLVGTEAVRQVGDLWVIAEGRGPMPGGGEAHMIMTLGYDPGRGRFTGSWVGSMMTHMWVYEGELDAEGRVLTLSAVGPDFEAPGRTRNYQDIIEVVDEDTRLLRSRMQGASGEWQDLMSARYTRRPG